MTGVSELVLEFEDLGAGEHFYAEVLGFPIVERWGDDATWVMAGERTRVGLWRRFVGIAGGRGGAHVHFAFHISEADYDAALDRLREHGYEPEEHRFESMGDSRAAYVTDPAGNVVELWTWDVAGHLRR